MIRNLLLATALFTSIVTGAQTQTYSTRAQQYILQYKDYAQAEQRRSGVPAAITLGQGILETEAGKSELATLANNHFGIKCKKEWTGETFAHDDDAPQECFRKYPSAQQSYMDHSDYLKTGKRYQSCFAQSTTDYAAWAKELRKCGYATNPKYAQILIKIIEDFHLQDYTYAAMIRIARPEALLASAASPVAAAMMADDDKRSATGEAAAEHDTPQETPVYGQVVRKDGFKGFYAHKGDVLLEYAIQYKVRYAKLLEMNGLPDAPLAADMFVYLEKGSRVMQIVSKDVSSPAATPVASAQETARIEAPAAAVAAPVKREEAPAAAISTPVKAEAPAAAPVAAEPVREAAVAASEKPANTAREAAAGEHTAATDEAAPQDEFSRLKARMDKVVYAPAPAKAAPAASTAPVPAPVAQKTPALASAAGAKVYHTVKSGETAFGIAKQYNIAMKELMTMNGLNFEAIKVGQKLRVK